MEKPIRFTLIHKETKVEKPFISYYSEPLKSDVEEWVSISDNVREKRVMWDVWEDTRFEAKLRLWKYIRAKQGNPIKRYNPYPDNSEIGKTIPILSF